MLTLLENVLNMYVLSWYEGNTCGLAELSHSFEFTDDRTFPANGTAAPFETFIGNLRIVLWIH